MTAKQAAERARALPWGYLATWSFFLAATATLFYIEVAFLEALWWRWVAIMVLSWWLPGLLLLWRWPPPGLNLLSAGLFALGLGLCWQIALLVLIHWLPGPLPDWLLVGVYLSGAALLLVLCWRRPFPVKSIDRTVLGWFLVLLVLALLLRLPELGYHEFHQDETHLVRRANEALRGADDALARHTKGIGEIAVVMVVYRALDTVNEGSARLPFALASVGSILALGLLGMQLFQRRIGFVAGLLLAINGFALGLSLIAQYQGVVLLLSVLAFLALWEFYQQQRRSWLTLALLLSAFGLVMHYEFVLNLLPLLALLIGGWRRAGRQDRGLQRGIAKTLLWAGGAGVVIVAATYLPLLLNPYFATTQNYLQTRVDDLQANNFAFFFEMATFYNSIYFIVGLLLFLSGGIVIGIRNQCWQILLLIAWALPAALLYFFIVQYPGTHFYIMMPSLSLLAAVAVVTVEQWLHKQSRGLRWSYRTGLMFWSAISVYYLYLLFFQQSPAYLANYREERLPFYWAPYGEQVPLQPRFGFPIHEGWKTLGVLGAWGYLHETYTSNERSDALRWYLRDYDRVPLAANPDYVFVTRAVQELDPAFDDDDLAVGNYQQIGEIRVAGEPQIAIWAQRSPAANYLSYDAELFAQAFDETVPALRKGAGTAHRAVNTTIAETLTLQTVTQSCVRCSGNEVLQLSFNWQVKQPLTHDYKLFVHVTNAQEQPVAQWDGLPGQNTARATTWQPNTQRTDHVLILLPADLPHGEYQIRVGFYDPTTGQRLGDQSLQATTIEVGF